MGADLHENKKHSYVDRRSKFQQGSINECTSVPSAVFNQFALSQRTNVWDYQPPGCTVSDIPDKPGNAASKQQQKVMIQDVTVEWAARAEAEAADKQKQLTAQ